MLAQERELGQEQGRELGQAQAPEQALVQERVQVRVRVQERVQVRVRVQVQVRVQVPVRAQVRVRAQLLRFSPGTSGTHTHTHIMARHTQAYSSTAIPLEPHITQDSRRWEIHNTPRPSPWCLQARQRQRPRQLPPVSHAPPTMTPEQAPVCVGNSE